MEMTEPLVSASDGNLVSQLDWIIVKDGPGTWAKNAYWDEYLIRVTNQSADAITVTGVTVVDGLATTVDSAADRKTLVKASKQARRRFKKQDLDVRPGAGSGVLIAAGTASFVVGSSIAYATAMQGLLATSLGGTAASTSGAAMVGATALVFAAPVMVVGGIVKASNNSRVDKEIKNRQVELPIELAAGEVKGFNVFFPVSPSPMAINVTYENSNGVQTLTIPTAEELQGLHIKSHASPAEVEAQLAEERLTDAETQLVEAEGGGK